MLEDKAKINGGSSSRYENWEIPISIDSIEATAKVYDIPALHLAIELLRNRHPHLADSKNNLSNILNDLSSTIMPNSPTSNTISHISDSQKNWKAIQRELGVSKKSFGKKINFVSDRFKREIIFRDVEHAYILASQGFSKPAVILAGGVIEELLRLYLEHKNIKSPNGFIKYIETCEQNKLLKKGTSFLSTSVRHFRNLVHLAKEETKMYTISKSTAKGAVASIFTIANDF